MFVSEWREFPSAPFMERGEGLVNSSRLDVKSPASMICFRVYFIPVRAKDLSAPGKNMGKKYTERKISKCGSKSL